MTQKTTVKIRDEETNENLGQHEIIWQKVHKGESFEIQISPQAVEVDFLYDCLWTKKTLQISEFICLVGEEFSNPEPKTLFIQHSKGKCTGVISFK